MSLIVIYNSLIYKCIIFQAQYAIKEWDDARDTAMRCLAINNNCIQALSLEITFILSRNGNYQDVCYTNDYKRLYIYLSANSIKLYIYYNGYH